MWALIHKKVKWIKLDKYYTVGKIIYLIIRVFPGALFGCNFEMGGKLCFADKNLWWHSVFARINGWILWISIEILVVWTNWFALRSVFWKYSKFMQNGEFVGARVVMGAIQRLGNEFSLDFPPSASFATKFIRFLAI